MAREMATFASHLPWFSERFPIVPTAFFLSHRPPHKVKLRYLRSSVAAPQSNLTHSHWTTWKRPLWLKGHKYSASHLPH